MDGRLHGRDDQGHGIFLLSAVWRSHRCGIILNAVTWKYDWIQQNKKRCFQFAEVIIARQKNGGTKNLQESRFVEDFIQYAATLPEPNRRVLDMMYEAAWYIICIYRFGMTKDQVPEPWYDTVSEVRKNGKEHADGKC